MTTIRRRGPECKRASGFGGQAEPGRRALHLPQAWCSVGARTSGYRPGHLGTLPEFGPQVVFARDDSGRSGICIWSGLALRIRRLGFESLRARKIVKGLSCGNVAVSGVGGQQRRVQTPLGQLVEQFQGHHPLRPVPLGAGNLGCRPPTADLLDLLGRRYLLAYMCFLAPAWSRVTGCWRCLRACGFAGLPSGRARSPRPKAPARTTASSTPPTPCQSPRES